MLSLHDSIIARLGRLANLVVLPDYAAIAAGLPWLTYFCRRAGSSAPSTCARSIGTRAQRSQASSRR
jgi:hypothetical protein